MFQICGPDQKVQRKESHCYILEFFSKCNDWEYQNTQYSSSMELNKCIQ